MAEQRTLKIVHVVATGTGAPWMVALARAQKELGHTIEVIVPERGPIAGELAQYGIPVHIAAVDMLFGPLNPFSKLKTIVRLVRLFRRLRPDVVHSHIVNSVVTCRLASWIADVPVHFGGNVHPFSLESELLREIEVRTAFCDTATIASSTYTRDLYIRYGVPRSQVELIFYAVDQSRHDPATADPDRVRRELRLDGEAPVVGNVAYFYPPISRKGGVPRQLRGRGIKGHDVLIRAVPHVLQKVPDAKFVLIGRGWGPRGAAYELELRNLAETLGVADSVLFAGYRSDIADVLASFDISIQCSLTDNLGGTVESLLMERPLVVSDIGGFKDTVIHEQTGLVVPVDDPVALAAAVVRLLADRDLGRRLGAAGRQRMLEHFTLARTVAATQSLLERTAIPDRGYRLGRTCIRAITLPVRLFPLLPHVVRTRMKVRS